MDENSKIGDGGSTKTTTDNSATGNPNSEVSANSNADANLEAPDTASDVAVVRSRQSARTPFTNLSQVDADLALARTLQEQERAYMMLSLNGGGANYGRLDVGVYFHDDEDDNFGDSHDHDYDEVDDEEEANDDVGGGYEDEEDIDVYDDDDDDEGDVFVVHAYGDSEENNAHGDELDPNEFPDDEAYARALQDAEEREMAARLLAVAGLTEREIVDVEDQGDTSQNTWEELDLDELSYEELIALGEVVGTESRGLSADAIASLPSTNFEAKISREVECDSCIICRLEYEDGEALTTLPCKHAYHSECINKWLKINKACPVCGTEASTSGNC